MRISIRWKLFASYVGVVIVTVVPIYFYLNHLLERQVVEETTTKLLEEAAVASFVFTHSRDGNNPIQFRKFAIELSDRSRSRVTIVAPDGRVVGDSDIPVAELAQVENHLARPEIQQAMQLGKGSSIRYSATLRSEMLYAASRIDFPDGTGAIRLALPLTVMDRLKNSLHGTLAGAIGFSALISLLMTVVFSHWLFRLISRVKEFAEDFGSGNLSRRMPEHRRDEFGALALAMNSMAQRLQEQMDKIASDRNRLDAILHGMGEGVIMTDNRGVITLVNSAFRTMFGLGGEVAGRSLIDVSRHPHLNESLTGVIQQKEERIEEVTVSHEPPKTALIHWVPLREGDELTGVIAVFHDISDLKRLEKVRKDFVANVSHELRTPITVIRGYAEALLDGALTGDPELARRFVRIILAHSDRLANLVTDLLSLSAMESGDFVLQRQPIKLHPLVVHAIGLLEMKASAKGVRVQAQTQTADITFAADRGRLEQVLINLLDNGIKYTPAGGTVSVAARVNGESVEIVVKDTGIGIPQASVPRIFERFYRVDPSRSREEGGTGLGLAIVKHIVQLHGGSIRVDTAPGKGTSFILSFPRG